MSKKNNQKTRLKDDLESVRENLSKIKKTDQEQNLEVEQLRENTARFRHALDSAPLGVFFVDVKGRIKYINSVLQKMFDISSNNETDELISNNFPPFVTTGISDEIQKCLEKRKYSVFESPLNEKSGETTWSLKYLNPILNRDGSIHGVLGVVVDITKQKKSERGLEQQLGFKKNMHMVLSRLIDEFDFDEAINSILSYLGELSKASRSFIFLLNDNNTVMSNTHEWCANGISSQIDNLQNLPSEKFPWWMKKLIQGESIFYSDISEMDDKSNYEKAFLKSQEVKSYLLTPINTDEKFFGFIGYFSISETQKWKEEDIFLLKAVSDTLRTFLERKKFSERQREKDERFQRLALASLEGIVIIDKGKIIDSNHIAGSLLGYKPSELIGKELIDFVEEKEKSHIQKFIQTKTSKPVESLVKKKEGSIIPVEIQTMHLSIQKEALHAVVIRDTSERKQKAKTDQKDLSKIKKVLYGSIKTLATAVGLRDPFTEGHGQGVAQLACAIGQEMGLPEDKIEGLRISAIIHDIGKVSIPVEILNKPGKISEAEFLIVKTHPRVGYDLLKNIEFPWPIAKIVLQHHERMNGSGYPDGISGDKILLEARIIAVAEVIHTILSNRSYRPAKSVVNVIEEISKNKGELYDSNVVEAALKIVTKEEFAFENYQDL